MNVPRYKCSVRVLVCLDCESYARQPFIMSHSFTNRFTHAAWGLTQKGRSDKKKSFTQLEAKQHPFLLASTF